MGNRVALENRKTPPTFPIEIIGAYRGVDMKKIKLTQNKVALVDDEDYEYLNQFKWCAHKDTKTYYAKRWVNTNTMITMHHEIIGYPPVGFETDHKSGNGLNNQRYNLRNVTHRQNCQNKKNIIKASRYPGVSWHNQTKKWRARIWINVASKHLGLFFTEIEAFNAYRNAVHALGETVIGE